MKCVAALLFFLAQAVIVTVAQANTVSLRLGGKEVPLAANTQARLTALTREVFSRCGPNTRQHPRNFGASVALVAPRRAQTLDGSRLHVVYEPAFETVSHLGGTLKVSEATLGLEGNDLFVGPAFTRDGPGMTEHLLCEYLPALEIACLPELAPHLPRLYAETCARFERGSDGRILMPPPDIAPSCS